jgi:hypothetical protein
VMNMLKHEEHLRRCEAVKMELKKTLPSYLYDLLNIFTPSVLPFKKPAKQDQQQVLY